MAKSTAAEDLRPITLNEPNSVIAVPKQPHFAAVNADSAINPGGAAPGEVPTPRPQVFEGYLQKPRPPRVNRVHHPEDLLAPDEEQSAA